MNKVLKRFWTDIGGLIWLAVGLFLTLTLWSYHSSDPSFNSTGQGGHILNYCGYFGSFSADLLYQLFGLTAWVFPLACFRMSFRSFSGRGFKVELWRISVAVLLFCTLSSLIALYFPDQRLYGNQITWGGLLGLAISGGLKGVFNPVGVGLILNTLAAVFLVFYTEKSLKELFSTPLGAGRKAGSWLGTWVKPPSIRELMKKLTPLSVTFEPAPATEPSGGPKLFRMKKEDPSPAVPSRFLPIPKNEGVASLQGEVFEEEPGPSIEGFFSKVRLKSSEEPRLQRRKIKTQVRVENWEMPKLSLLEDPPQTRTRLDEREIKNKAKILIEKLAQFSVRGEVTGIKPGPAVTMFELKPAADVKISKITDLADDLSLALSSESVRMIAPIPGRDVVGIETSNSQRESVYLKDILEHEPFWDEDVKLPLALGRQADGEPRVVDLRKMPHLLVAGTTGSGKSVFVVSALTGLLFRHSPKTLKLILIDPKQVDLAAFNDLPHLIMPPVREPKKAVGALRWAIKEMEKRYRSMSKFGARGIEGFNEIVDNLSSSEREEHETFLEELESPYHPDSYYCTPQPYVVIVVEEFGDLMAVDKVNVEQSVVRLAQMARACGIHLILAMQSPRKDVVTGLIKTNIPGRISFKVASKMDSRIILDEAGGERLLARGDMLFLAPGVAKPERHHGAYLAESEITRLVDWWKDQGPPEYNTLAMRALEGSGSSESSSEIGFEEDDDIERDEKYDEVLAYVASQKEVSASLLQRKFRLGYPRAARMIEKFEAEGVVGPANGSKPRQVLVRDLKEL